MKLFLALAALLCAPASAGELSKVPALDLPIQKALAGSMCSPLDSNHPILERMDGVAREIMTVRDIHLPANLNAARKLEALSASPHVADRLTAAAMARLIDEPQLSRWLAERRSERTGSPLLRLPEALRVISSYREAPSHGSSSIAQLARAARSHEAVSALFDHEAQEARLDVAGLSGSSLFVEGNKAAQLGWTTSAIVFDHPGLPGASIEVGVDKHAPDASPHEALQMSEHFMTSLAGLGHAPRTLGRDVVFKKGFGKDPLRAVVIREKVAGRSLDSLIWDNALSNADRARIREAGLAYLRLGGDLSKLKAGHIVLGSTVLRPEPRAYFVDAGVLGPGKPGKNLDAEANAWLENLELEVALQRARAGRGLANFKF